MPRRTPGMTAERAVGAVGRADEAQWVRDTSGAVTDDAMTRSEERPRVRTESQPASRVRLRKHVVTEYQQVTVPVRREEIRLEREPAVDPDPDVTASTSDDGTPVETRPPVGSEAAGLLRSDDEHVVTLYEERPVLGTETVPSSASAWASRPSSSSRPSAARSAEKRSNSTPTPTSTTRADRSQQEMTSPPE